MGFFKTEPTDLEIYIKENFKYADDEIYNKFTIEDEGEFIKIKRNEEDSDGDTTTSRPELPSEQ
jgi:hypothetical protein